MNNKLLYDQSNLRFIQELILHEFQWYDENSEHFWKIKYRKQNLDTRRWYIAITKTYK